MVPGATQTLPAFADPRAGIQFDAAGPIDASLLRGLPGTENLDRPCFRRLIVTSLALFVLVQRIPERRSAVADGRSSPALQLSAHAHARR